MGNQKAILRPGFVEAGHIRPKKKEVCPSFLRPKTLSAMQGFFLGFFSSKKNPTRKFFSYCGQFKKKKQFLVIKKEAEKLSKPREKNAVK